MWSCLRDDHGRDGVGAAQIPGSLQGVLVRQPFGRCDTLDVVDLATNAPVLTHTVDEDAEGAAAASALPPLGRAAGPRDSPVRAQRHAGSLGGQDISSVARRPPNWLALSQAAGSGCGRTELQQALWPGCQHQQVISVGFSAAAQRRTHPQPLQ
jgi:hypothetical protein